MNSFGYPLNRTYVLSSGSIAHRGLRNRDREVAPTGGSRESEFPPTGRGRESDGIHRTGIPIARELYRVPQSVT